MVGLIQTMRDIDETDIKDDEALKAKQAFTAALSQLATRPSVPEQERGVGEEATAGVRGGPGAAVSRWPHNTFRIWTARKPQTRSIWRLF